MGIALAAIGVFLFVPAFVFAVLLDPAPSRHQTRP